jgi:hypothetical protein
LAAIDDHEDLGVGCVLRAALAIACLYPKQASGYVVRVGNFREKLETPRVSRRLRIIPFANRREPQGVFE